ALQISPPLIVDGDFGNKTDAAVKRYQAKYGLAIDGVVGRKTWAKLNTAAPALPHQGRSTQTFNNAPWMNIANREMGQKEIRGRDHNPRIVAYHSTTTLRATDDETPWCASFVNWCLKQKNIRGTNSAAAASWLNWGRPIGAKPGAIAIIYNHAAANSNLTRSGNHVAFLIQETHTHFKLLGGNQSDQVKISSYPKSKWRLKGYRWPA
ncbi:MAG: TIGR02594 family protein, partial [Pseudomonadales bacterium]|nr:TIGR02594 family protein [Pseudomonadales bacterium]